MKKLLQAMSLSIGLIYSLQAASDDMTVCDLHDNTTSVDASLLDQKYMQVDEAFTFFKQNICVKDLLPYQQHIRYEEIISFFGSRITVLKQLLQLAKMSSECESIFCAKATVLRQSFDVMIAIHGAMTFLLLSFDEQSEPLDCILQVQRLCLDANYLAMNECREAFNRVQDVKRGLGKETIKACAARFVYQSLPKNIKGSAVARFFERVLKCGMQTKIRYTLLQSNYGPEDLFYQKYIQVACQYALCQMNGFNNLSATLDDGLKSLISLLQNMHINYGDKTGEQKNTNLFAATHKLYHHLLAVKNDLEVQDNFSFDYAKDVEKRLIAIIHSDLIKSKNFTKITRDYSFYSVAQQYQVSLNLFLRTSDYSSDLLFSLCKIEYDLHNLTERCARTGLSSFIWGQTPVGLVIEKMLQATQLALASVQAKLVPDKGFFGKLLAGDWSTPSASAINQPGIVAQWASKLFGTQLQDNTAVALHAAGRISPLAIMAVLKCAAPYMTESLRKSVIYFLTGVEQKSKREQEDALSSFLKSNPEIIMQLCADNSSLKQIFAQYIN